MRLLSRDHGEGLEPFNSARMTPMIDVVFQLLIFFMCGMKFKTQEGRLEAYLPATAKDSTPPVETPIEVRVQLIMKSDNEVGILIQGARCPSFALLYAKLADLGRVSRALPVVIDGAPDVPYAAVLTALDACVSAKLTKISFAQPPAL